MPEGGREALQTQLRPAGHVHVIAGGNSGKHESDRTPHVATWRVRKKGRKKGKWRGNRSFEVVIVFKPPQKKERKRRG